MNFIGKKRFILPMITTLFLATAQIGSANANTSCKELPENLRNCKPYSCILPSLISGDVAEDINDAPSKKEGMTHRITGINKDGKCGYERTVNFQLTSTLICSFDTKSRTAAAEIIKQAMGGLRENGNSPSEESKLLAKQANLEGNCRIAGKDFKTSTPPRQFDFPEK